MNESRRCMGLGFDHHAQDRSFSQSSWWKSLDCCRSLGSTTKFFQLCGFNKVHDQDLFLFSCQFSTSISGSSTPQSNPFSTEPVRSQRRVWGPQVPHPHHRKVRNFAPRVQNFLRHTNPSSDCRGFQTEPIGRDALDLCAYISGRILSQTLPCGSASPMIHPCLFS